MTRGWALRIGLAVALGLAVVVWSRWIPTWMDGWWRWAPLAAGSRWGWAADWFAWGVNPVVPTGALVLVALWAGRRRLFRLAAQLLISATLSLALVTLLKVLIGRERPETPWLGILSADASYPSGHAAGAAVLAFGLISLAGELRWTARRQWIWAAVWLAVMAVIGVDRLLLGVHHVSDVLGGVLASLFAHAVAVALTYAPTSPLGAPPGARFSVVVNPTKVRDARLLRRIVLAESGRRGWRLEAWRETTREDPGIAASRLAVEGGSELVLVVGGDGTQRAGCTALAHSPATLGLIPHGSGDLLARALGIPRDLPSAVRAAFDGRATPVDVLRVDLDGRNEVSAVMVGLGADAAVLRDTNDTLKRWIGPFAYLFAGAKHVAARPVPTRVLVDNVVAFDGPASLVEVGNVAELRPGVALLPGASPTDGAAYVLTAAPDGAGDVARMIAGVLVGATHDRQLERKQGTRVEVTAATPVPCQIDGELMGDVTTLSCVVDPGAVRVAIVG